MEAAKSHKKRHLKIDHGNRRKSQRVLSTQKSSEHDTKIIDLNDDCLVKVFGYMDVQNLYHVAVANEWLRPAANEVYKRRFGDAMVVLQGCEIIRPNTRANIRNDSANKSFVPKFNDKTNLITVRGMKECLLYLRCLGESIRHLLIDFRGSDANKKQYGRVYRYINDYCANTLMSFSFFSMQKDTTIQQFQKSFVNVKEVRIYGNCLVQLQPSFVEWFPSLCNLKLIDIMEYGAVTKPFHQLENLTIVHQYWDGFSTDTIAANLLNGIDQLKTLCIGHGKHPPSTPINVWLDLIRNNTSLIGLYIDTIGPETMESIDVQRFLQEHSVLIALQLPNYRFKCEDAVRLVRQLDSLKQFQFEILHSEYAQLVSQLENDWNFNKIAYDCRHTCVTLVRK